VKILRALENILYRLSSTASRECFQNSQLNKSLSKIYSKPVHIESEGSAQSADQQKKGGVELSWLTWYINKNCDVTGDSL
jgi:hypothetical protein